MSTIEGLDSLTDAFNDLVKKVHSGEPALLLAQAELVRDAIKEAAPLGPTGNLKAAAYAIAYPATATENAVAYAGIRPRKAPHGHLVEYGHGGPHPAPPHPFFRPTWDGMKNTIQNNISEGLGKIVVDAL